MFGGFFDIIFFAAFAAFIAYRLFNVLGREDFNDDITQNPTQNKEQTKDTVVNFPNGNTAQETVDVPFKEIALDYEEMKEKYGVEIAAKIQEIRRYDPNFTDENFIMGARSAFEIILDSFSKGDGKKLKPLLGKDVYKGFIDEIEKRNKAGNKEETTVVSVAANIKDIVLNKKLAKIAVNFISEQINLVKDKNGKVIEGDPSQVDRIEEIWTFSRNLTSSNPNWELIQTGAAS